MVILLTSILAGILMGATESINKKITEKKYSVFAYAFLQNSGNALLFFLFFFSDLRFLNNFWAYLYILFTAILIVIANSCLIKACKSEGISSISVISRLSLVIAFFSGVVLLSEQVNVLNIIGVLLIIFGVMVIFIKKKRFKLSPGLFFAFVSSLCFGLVSYSLKITYNHVSFFSALFHLQILLSLFYLIIPSTRKDILPVFMKYRRNIIVSRFTAASGIYLISWSIKNGPISVVNTNYETFFLLSSVLIGILLLKERADIRQIIFGSVLCMVGIFLLNFY